MKKFLSLALFLLSISAPLARADIEGAPFIPEVDRRFNAIEQGNHYQYSKFPMGSVDGHWTQQIAQATYNFAVQTGATGYSDLGISIPAGAVIQQAAAYSITKPTTSASGTLAFACGSSGSAFLNATAAASFATAGSAIAGNQTGAAATWTTNATKCDINSAIATGALTAGKVTLFVSYWVHQ